MSSGKTTLFIAKHDSSYRIWCGEIYPPSHFLLSYGVDEVLYTEDLASWVEKELSLNENAKLHLMRGVNSDSGSEALPAAFKGDAAFADKRDYSVAYGIIELARVTKCPEELDVMRYAAWVASNAHVAVMRSAKDSSFEYELEATFLYEIYKNGGCRKSAYTSICACGPNAATLHYGHAGAPNEVELRSHQIVSCCLLLSFFFHLLSRLISGSPGHGCRVSWVRLGHYLFGRFLYVLLLQFMLISSFLPSVPPLRHLL